MRQDAISAAVEETRSDAEPAVRVPPGPAQGERIEALKQEIEASGGSVHVSRWNDKKALSVQVDLPGGAGSWSWRYSTSVNVFFFGDELRAGYAVGDTGAPLGGLPHLQRAIAVLREKLLERRAREQKREKIRKLKERSIESQVTALAGRVGFSYALEPMHTKVKLAVRLTKEHALVVDIPYGRIQEVLADLPPLIERVRELYRSGARFKVEGSQGYRFREPAAGEPAFNDGAASGPKPRAPSEPAPKPPRRAS
jgi:hypothetical protein